MLSACRTWPWRSVTKCAVLSRANAHCLCYKQFWRAWFFTVTRWCLTNLTDVFESLAIQAESDVEVIHSLWNEWPCMGVTFQAFESLDLEETFVRLRINPTIHEEQYCWEVQLCWSDIQKLKKDVRLPYFCRSQIAFHATHKQHRKDCRPGLH